MSNKAFLISGFFKHWLKAKNEHSLHSPFLFDLYTKVVKGKKQFYAFAEIEKERKRLLNDNSTIAITDFGAGSVVNNKRERLISDIAKNSLKPAKQSHFLFRLVNYLQPTNIIELGTSLGITTAYLASENHDRKVYTLEGCPNTLNVAKKVFSNLNLNNIEPIEGDFAETLPSVVNKLDEIGLLYVDGNHQYQPTIDYFKLCLPKVGEESVFVFDDIYWSKGMKQAWEEIKLNPEVKLSIDLFYFGLVFFRNKQPKQDFILKF